MAREHHNYLHIPKTAGTALKYVVDDHNRDNSKSQPVLNVPNAGHNQNLSNMNNACFVIRHPWERFCSGFWERVNMPKRKELSKTTYNNLRSFGYKDYDSVEQELLEKYKTPNEFLTYLREGGDHRGSVPGLFELTASMTHWIGNLDKFKDHEHRIKLVFHINNINRVMKEVYNITMPDDPFMKRSKSMFEQSDPYYISGTNRTWFEENFREEDYKLIAYIKQRPYYHE